MDENSFKARHAKAYVLPRLNAVSSRSSCVSLSGEEMKLEEHIVIGDQDGCVTLKFFNYELYDMVDDFLTEHYGMPCSYFFDQWENGKRVHVMVYSDHMDPAFFRHILAELSPEEVRAALACEEVNEVPSALSKVVIVVVSAGLILALVIRIFD